MRSAAPNVPSASGELFPETAARVEARRATKARERGFGAAVALLVDRGARALSRVLFALEGRWTPLDHWLERELATLEDPSGAARHLLAALRDRGPEAVTAGFES